jgi:hypothetical protein
MKLAAFLLCLLLPLSAWPQQAPPERVLFVGNSYTYYWNLPQQVAAMAAAQGTPLAARQSVSGGVSLGLHWEGKRGLKTKDLIASGAFDAIVLQDHSLRPALEADSTLLYGRLLAELAQAYNARVYVYLTWARRENPLLQELLDEGCRRFAATIGATIVPVGPAWQLALQHRPDIRLHELDGSHPSPLGSYLSACVFYAVLTGKSPIGLPHQLTTTAENGETIYLNIVHPDEALFCQQVAAEAIRRYGS